MIYIYYISLLAKGEQDSGEFVTKKVAKWILDTKMTTPHKTRQNFWGLGISSEVPHVRSTIPRVLTPIILDGEDRTGVVGCRNPSIGRLLFHCFRYDSCLRINYYH